MIFYRQSALRGNQLFLMLMFALLTFFGVLANAQDNSGTAPYASFWFPSELLSWKPETDPHARFNVSQVPLASRFITEGANPDQPQPGITALIASHPTSNHPSQGFDSAQQYVFPFWSHLDYFVQWGGSSYEGLIISPAVPWIDAAHRNGVAVLGTVFFPPNVYGGKEEWVREFLQKDSKGAFPMVDKLIEVAEHYGFEGWFINQETHGMNGDDARLMVEWLKYYQQKATGKFKVMWYDSMLEDGRVIWQEELNDHNEIFFESAGKVSDIMFLDFGWTAVNLEDTRKKSLELGRSPWEIYAGIDVQSGSYRTYANWEALYSKEGELANTSIALYWPNSTFDVTQSKRPEDVYQEELKFWNGTKVAFKERNITYEWKGFTNYIVPRSTITQLPFVTRFNYGTGYHFNIDGKEVASNEWHNLSNQDILPHWQWEVDTTKVKAGFDFEASYNGGTSLKFELKPEEKKVRIPLYKMSLALPGGAQLSVATKSELPAIMNLVLESEDGPEVSIPIEVGNSWRRVSHNLSKYKHRKFGRIYVEIVPHGNEENTLWLGEIAITERKSKAPEKPVATIETHQLTDGFSAYLGLQGLPENVWYHDVFSVNKTGRSWLKRSSSKDIFLPYIREKGQITLVPVGHNGKAGKSLTLTIE